MSVLVINPFVFQPANLEVGEVTIVNTAQSSLSVSNRTSHTYTYNFNSTTQDGTVMLFIQFHGDDNSEALTVNSPSMTLIESTTGGGKLNFYYYFPSQGELNSGSLNFSISSAGGEVYQYTIFELHGVDPDLPYTSVRQLVVSSGTSVGPHPINVVTDNALAISSFNCGYTATMSVSNANNFTTHYTYQPVSGIYGNIITSQAVDLGVYDSPVFASNTARALSQLTTVFNPVNYLTTLSGVNVLATRVSNLSISNRTSHSYDYTFVSKTQNGSVHCIVIFFGDDGDEPVTPDSDVTKFAGTTLNDGGQIWAGLFTPTQTQLNAGSKTFNFTTAGAEVYQFLVYEVIGLNSTTPILDIEVDESNGNRSSVPSASLTATGNGSVLISACVANYTVRPNTITISTANSFNQDTVQWNDTINGFGSFVSSSRRVDAGTYSTPVFSLTSGADEMNMLSFVLNPE